MTNIDVADDEQHFDCDFVNVIIITFTILILKKCNNKNPSILLNRRLGNYLSPLGNYLTPWDVTSSMSEKKLSNYGIIEFTST